MTTRQSDTLIILVLFVVFVLAAVCPPLAWGGAAIGLLAIAFGGDA